MTTRNYLRVLLVITILHGTIVGAAYWSAAKHGVPPGVVAGYLVTTVAAIAGLFGQRWGRIIVGVIVLLSVFLGLQVADRLVGHGQSVAGAVAAANSITWIAIGVGLVFLRPEPTDSGQDPSIPQ